MAKLWEMFASQKRQWQQQREIDQLRKELAALRSQNESMREGMRRCVTCEYRIDFKQRQDGATDSPKAPPLATADNKP